MTADQTNRPQSLPHLLCDAPGCPEEMIMCSGGEQYCFEHALARGNEDRAKVGLPPVSFDEEHGFHVKQ